MRSSSSSGSHAGPAHAPQQDEQGRSSELKVNDPSNGFGLLPAPSNDRNSARQEEPSISSFWPPNPSELEPDSFFSEPSAGWTDQSSSLMGFPMQGSLSDVDPTPAFPAHGTNFAANNWALFEEQVRSHTSTPPVDQQPPRQPLVHKPASPQKSIEASNQLLGLSNQSAEASTSKVDGAQKLPVNENYEPNKLQQSAALEQLLEQQAVLQTPSRPNQPLPLHMPGQSPAQTQGDRQQPLHLQCGPRMPSTSSIYIPFMRNANIVPSTSNFFYHPRSYSMGNLSMHAGSPDRLTLFSTASSSTSTSPASVMTASTSAGALHTPPESSPLHRRGMRRSLSTTVEAAGGMSNVPSKQKIPCQFCGVTVSRMDSLTRHVKRKHPIEVQLAGGNTGAGPLGMPGIFPSRKSPASTSASRASSPLARSESRAKEVKKLYCPLCGLSLSRADSLVRHIKKQHKQSQSQTQVGPQTPSQAGSQTPSHAGSQFSRQFSPQADSQLSPQADAQSPFK